MTPSATLERLFRTPLVYPTIARRPRAERFWEKVEVNSHGCWFWTAHVSPSGYGRFSVDGRTAYAHRVAYELAVGQIPVGLQIDHLCSNKRCVRPDHLEVVTNAENTRRAAVRRREVGVVHHGRQERCQRGHALTGENRYVAPCGQGHCRKCKALADTIARLKRRTVFLSREEMRVAS